jgi:hypothetical protein
MIIYPINLVKYLFTLEFCCFSLSLVGLVEISNSKLLKRRENK